MTDEVSKIYMKALEASLKEFMDRIITTDQIDYQMQELHCWVCRPWIIGTKTIGSKDE